MNSIGFITISAAVIALGATAGYLGPRYLHVEPKPVSVVQSAGATAPPVSLAATIEQARGLFGKRKPAEAQALLQQALRTHPEAVDRAEARKLLGYINRCLFFSSESGFGKTEYVVKRGDSLWRIARTLGTTPDELMRLNKLKSTVIHPGDRLSLPDGEFAVTIDLPRKRVVVKHKGFFMAEYAIVEAEVPQTGGREVVTAVKEASLRMAGEKVPPEKMPAADTARLWIELERAGYVLYAVPSSTNTGGATAASPDPDAPAQGIALEPNDLKQLQQFVDQGTPVTVVRAEPQTAG